MIKETTIYDFKTHLSRYIAALEGGKYEKIIVKRRNQVVGEFVPTRQQHKTLKIGLLAGRMSKGEVDAFFDPALDKAVEDDFYRTSALSDESSS